MSEIPTKSLAWLDKLEDIRALLKEDPNLTQTTLIEKFGYKPANASYLTTLRLCLNQTAIDRIRQAAQAGRFYVLSFNSARALARLKGKVPDLPIAVRAALEVAITRNLTTSQIGALVKWMVSGKPATEFDPSQVETKKPGPKPKRQLTALPTDSLSVGATQASRSAGGGNPRSKDTQKQPEVEGSQPPPSPKPVEAAQKARSKGQPIRPKGKGKSLLLDFSIRAGRGVWKLLQGLMKEVFHYLQKTARWLAKLVGGAAGGLLEKVLCFVFIVLLIWGGYEYFFHHMNLGGVLKRQLAVLASKLSVERPTKKDEPPSPAAPKRYGSGQGAPKGETIGNEAAATNSISTNPDAQSTQLLDESKAYWEGEVAAVPLPAKIKGFFFQPDKEIGVMAGRYLRDLKNPGIYSLMVGHNRQKVLSVLLEGPGFTLTYSDPSANGDQLEGPPKMEFSWADIKIIHCDEIQTGTSVVYQCGLVVEGLKPPFVVQCASADDLRHLVSALEYWVRVGNNDQEAPLGSLPSLSQGLRLEGTGKVALLWDGSAADQAGLELGDGIWSLYSDSNQPQGKTNLEAALDSLTPGKHTLYVVTPADWGNGPSDNDNSRDHPFNPKRQKIELLVP